jgi:hypothetical protein
MYDCCEFASEATDTARAVGRSRLRFRVGSLVPDQVDLTAGRTGAGTSIRLVGVSMEKGSPKSGSSMTEDATLALAELAGLP